MKLALGIIKKIREIVDTVLIFKEFKYSWRDGTCIQGKKVNNKCSIKEVKDNSGGAQRGKSLLCNGGSSENASWKRWNFWTLKKTGGIEIPREDGQAFEIGRMASAVERRLDYVTCW